MVVGEPPSPPAPRVTLTWAPCAVPPSAHLGWGTRPEGLWPAVLHLTTEPRHPAWSRGHCLARGLGDSKPPLWVSLGLQAWGQRTGLPHIYRRPGKAGGVVSSAHKEDTRDRLGLAGREVAKGSWQVPRPCPQQPGSRDLQEWTGLGEPWGEQSWGARSHCPWKSPQGPGCQLEAPLAAGCPAEPCLRARAGRPGFLGLVLGLAGWLQAETQRERSPWETAPPAATWAPGPGEAPGGSGAGPGPGPLPTRGPL